MRAHTVKRMAFKTQVILILIVYFTGIIHAAATENEAHDRSAEVLVRSLARRFSATIDQQLRGNPEFNSVLTAEERSRLEDQFGKALRDSYALLEKRGFLITGPSSRKKQSRAMADYEAQTADELLSISKQIQGLLAENRSEPPGSVFRQMGSASGVETKGDLTRSRREKLRGLIRRASEIEFETLVLAEARQNPPSTAKRTSLRLGGGAGGALAIVALLSTANALVAMIAKDSPRTPTMIAFVFSLIFVAAGGALANWASNAKDKIDSEANADHNAQRSQERMIKRIQEQLKRLSVEAASDEKQDEAALKQLLEIQRALLEGVDILPPEATRFRIAKPGLTGSRIAPQNLRIVAIAPTVALDTDVSHADLDLSDNNECVARRIRAALR